MPTSKSLRSGLALTLACAFAAPSLFAQTRAGAQRRTQAPRPGAGAPARHPAPRAATATPAAADARMTGVYLLDAAAGQDPAEVARAAADALPPEARQRALADLSARLNAPGQIAIQRRGRTFDIASTRAPRITFEADGLTHTEPAADGHTVRTRAVVYGDTLMVSSRGNLDDEFSVSFDALDAGRRLRVTRRIYEPGLPRPVVVQSFYNKTSQAARFSVYGEPVPAQVAAARRFPPPSRPAPPAQTTATSRQPQAQTQPVIRPRPAPRPAQSAPPPFDGFYIGENARFVAVLDNDLSTERAREGDPFTMTVRGPAGFEGARIEGRVARVERGGPFEGRAGLTLEFERIRLPDGRAADFNGYIEGVRPAGGDNVRVDNESRGGDVEAAGSQTDRTVERTAIGAAVGAIVGAIAGGGKGAAIGAAIGAGAGLGSVYAQGRDDLELRRGTEVTLRAGPRR